MHFTQDLLPFWTSDAAKGVPIGNFPTFRGMDGGVRGSSARKPGMLGRQIYTYAMGYLLTGDESLLELARAGERWLLDHAWDSVQGGWHADLDAAGNALGSGDKTAQDMSYAAMGAAAYFFVTRDAEAEEAVLVTRDLLFDPAKFWDAAHARIRDAMDASLTISRSSGAAGAAELVSQLDPATAFLLLVQPVLTDAARREQVLGDLRALATAMRDDYWQDGMFWGATDLIGRYGTTHSDFGHTLKAYWALTQIDKRLPDHPLADFLAENAPAAVLRAYDAPYGRWASAPVSTTEVSFGTEWWAYAESDQLTATLALHDASLIPVLGQTAPISAATTSTAPAPRASSFRSRGAMARGRRRGRTATSRSATPGRTGSTGRSTRSS